MEKVRVGVVGLGEVAQIIHLPILQALADRYEIGALCDVSPTLLEAMGERYRVERLYADALEMAAQPDLDAVFVLNSDEYHADHALAAIRNGKHVLVEKPMCISPREAEAIIAARDEAGVQVMVAYMRRFAPAFVEAIEQVRELPKINFARVRDIIGANRLIIDQANVVLRPNDIPAEMGQDRSERASRLVKEAIGEASPRMAGLYRLLLGLSSHDLSAMKELIGSPDRVIAAAFSPDSRFLTAIFGYPGFNVSFETGVDEQRRFDAHLEVFGDTKQIKVEYDTPYIRHLPTTLVTNETVGESYVETVLRPTFKDPYTHELEYFHEVVTKNMAPKTPPEDFVEDLKLFQEMIEAARLNEPSA